MLEQEITQFVESPLTLENIKKRGFVARRPGVVQGDVVPTLVVTKNELFGTEGSFCDTNCVEPYRCPAARSDNLGLSLATAAPVDELLESFVIASEGLTIYQQHLIDSGAIHQLCQEFNIPVQIEEMHIESYLQKPLVNLFGGNPEVYKKIKELIIGLSRMKIPFDMSTTGAILLNPRRRNLFIEALQYPDLQMQAIAFSAEDFESPDHLKQLMSMELSELADAYTKIDFEKGQKRKAVAAIHATRLIRELGIPIKILFNMPTNTQNIGHIEEIISLLRLFSNIIVNPFFDQTAFYGESSKFRIDQIPLIKNFILKRIEEHFDEGELLLVPRLHYFLMQLAVLETYADSPHVMLDMLAGKGIWLCYNDLIANSCLQFGKAPKGHITLEGEKVGQKLGCFWNGTVTDITPLSSSTPGFVFNYLLSFMKQLSQNYSDPCKGCNFPRISSVNELTMLAGMNRTLVNAYLRLRMRFAGY